MERDLLDMESITQNKRTNQIVAQHSWTYGRANRGLCSSTSPNGSSTLGGVDAIAEFQSKAFRKKLRARARVWFTLFGPRVAEFEFAIHIRSKAWLSPTLEIAVRLINIRPLSSAIFMHAEDRIWAMSRA
jgi:hypothetical protein